MGTKCKLSVKMDLHFFACVKDDEFDDSGSPLFPILLSNLIAILIS
jgi:hypothetical protein